MCYLFSFSLSSPLIDPHRKSNNNNDNSHNRIETIRFVYFARNCGSSSRSFYFLHFPRVLLFNFSSVNYYLFCFGLFFHYRFI